MLSKHPIIGVMGSHDTAWEEFSAPVGLLLAEMGCHLLTGAGAGVMTAVAKAFTAVKKRKGLSIGIIPTIDYDGHAPEHDRYPNPYIEIPILTPLDKKAMTDSTPYSRNQVNVMTSHALIILPGEHGTQNEVSLALQYNKPIILFGGERNFDKFPSTPPRTQQIEDVRIFLEALNLNTKMDD